MFQRGVSAPTPDACLSTDPHGGRTPSLCTVEAAAGDTGPPDVRRCVHKTDPTTLRPPAAGLPVGPWDVEDPMLIRGEEGGVDARCAPRGSPSHPGRCSHSRAIKVMSPGSSRQPQTRAGPRGLAAVGMPVRQPDDSPRGLREAWRTRTRDGMADHSGVLRDGPALHRCPGRVLGW